MANTNGNDNSPSLSNNPPADSTVGLKIVQAAAGFDFHSLQVDDFNFVVGDIIALSDHSEDDDNDWYWRGKNSRTEKEGTFPYLYLRAETATRGRKESSSSEEKTDQILQDFNEKVNTRLLKKFRRIFGDDIDPITAYKVCWSVALTRYTDSLLCFAVAHPQISQWLVLLELEIEAFRTFAARYWWRSRHGFSFEGWKDSIELILRDGPDGWGWDPTIRKSRASIPTLEAVWTELRVELVQLKAEDKSLGG